jgi:hypothetical protein
VGCFVSMVRKWLVKLCYISNTSHKQTFEVMWTVWNGMKLEEQSWWSFCVSKWIGSSHLRLNIRSASIVWKARQLVCELESVVVLVIACAVVMLCCFSISIISRWNHENCCNSIESVLVLSEDSIEVVKVLASALFSWF